MADVTSELPRESAAPRRNLVPVTAERLREMVFAKEAGAQIGSLPDLSRELGLGSVTLRFAAMSGGPELYRGADGIGQWIAGRQRIVAAIIAGDEGLARFEADRSNRQVLLAWLRRDGAATSP